MFDSKKWAAENKESIAKRNKDYRERKKAELAAKAKERYVRNKERLNARNKERYAAMSEAEREALRADRRARYHRNKEKIANDPSVIARINLHSLVKSKKLGDARWLAEVGCLREDFIAHIESQFQEGMSWDNWTRDGWHMDHIIPLSKGGTNHYTNLQPLWADDNRKKAATVDKEL